MERRHPQRQSLNQDRQQVGLRSGAGAGGTTLGPSMSSPGNALAPACQVRTSLGISSENPVTTPSALALVDPAACRPILQPPQHRSIRTRPLSSAPVPASTYPVPAFTRRIPTRPRHPPGALTTCSRRNRTSTCVFALNPIPHQLERCKPTRLPLGPGRRGPGRLQRGSNRAPASFTTAGLTIGKSAAISRPATPRPTRTCLHNTPPPPPACCTTF